MSSLSLFILSICTLLASWLFSMLGLGGGSIYTPLQIFFGVPFRIAATTSLLLIVLSSLSALRIYAAAKKIDWTLAAILEVFAALGAVSGAFATHMLNTNMLALLFATIVTMSGISMMQNPQPLVSLRKKDKKLWLWERQSHANVYSINLLIAFPVCFLSGLISSLVGLGGGIIIVPLLSIGFAVPLDIAIGSSTVMVLVTSAIGFLTHLSVSSWDPYLLLYLAVVALIGGTVGAKTSIKINQNKLKRGFGFLMIIIAAMVVFQVFSGQIH